MAPVADVLAAGGIVWRKSSRPGGIEILLIRRIRYDDWSLPKGKLDPGEHLPTTAAREVWEETGHSVRLGHPLPPVRYRVAQGRKEVAFWMARPLGDPTKPFEPNDEVDEIRWVHVTEALSLLTYAHDRLLVETVAKLVAKGAHRSRTLVVARHGQAMAHDDWSGDDVDRPLVRDGLNQAEQLAPVLRAFGVRRVVTSPALRCQQTIAPFAQHARLDPITDARFVEGADHGAVAEALGEVIHRKKPVVVCSHRPMMSAIFEAISIKNPKLDPGEALIVHHRDGKVFATERFTPHRRR